LHKSWSNTELRDTLAGITCCIEDKLSPLTQRELFPHIGDCSVFVLDSLKDAGKAEHLSGKKLLRKLGSVVSLEMLLLC
jgi:hypothetical protein